MYELSRSEWESGSSLREAAKRFLHQFKTGALKATGETEKRQRGRGFRNGRGGRVKKGLGETEGGEKDG